MDAGRDSAATWLGIQLEVKTSGPLAAVFPFHPHSTACAVLNPQIHFGLLLSTITVT